MVLTKLRSIFFSLNPARKALSRVRTRHYQPIAALVSRWPQPLADLPADQVVSINLKSDDYFSNPAQQQYWRHKPFSDFESGPDCLWRFGLLLSALGIRRGDRVLDFGCGTGWTSMMMARTGAEVTGMDISPQAVAIAQKFAAESLSAEDRTGLRFQSFDGVKIDAPDGYFDVVVTVDAFHHFPNPVTILNEFHRVLSPYGYFGFTEPGHGHSGTYSARHESEHGVLETDVDPEQLRTTAKMAGFDELELIVLPAPPCVLTLTMPRARWYLRGLPWIVPHDYIRSSILSTPTGLLRKGPYIRTSLNPQGLGAEIRPLRKVINVTPGQEFGVAATVKNLTGTVWLKNGRRGTGYVQLGAHLLDARGQTLRHDYGRAALSKDMQQDDMSVIDLRLTAPEPPGRYVLRLDMVDEGIAWFSEVNSQPADVELVVGCAGHGMVPGGVAIGHQGDRETNR
jgi:2-polyprenyl-3-methyl-5-hydroxy-6-metoxy-1,4-benzoquinol methylase